MEFIVVVGGLLVVTPALLWLMKAIDAKSKGEPHWWRQGFWPWF
jgi:hypothetical protein